MNSIVVQLLVTKVALPALKAGLRFAVKKLSKMEKGLTKDVALSILNPIVESMDNPIINDDVVHLVEKLKD